jgi:anthranilate/para-aminobenzoate synthase component I
MIVDLLRNDLGRVCEYGSVQVESLCEIEQHPTLFHLVSTISGQLRGEASFTDVLRALFPSGSITGAPKIRTMEIIDEIEPAKRGLSMGAIGYYIPETGFEHVEPGFDLSVAIRTMVVRGREAVFNVGGGITIDSDPDAEFEETETKAKALRGAIGNK